MNNKQKRQVLFYKHAEDLSRVCTASKDRFVCPICFHVFTPEDLDKENTLTVGDVWPKDFRTQSRETDEQKVLLCQSCNSKGGDSYDAAMNELERFRETQKSGEPFIQQFVSIFLPNNPSRKRIRMKLFVIQRKGGLSLSETQMVVKNDGITQKYGEIELGLFPLTDEAGQKRYKISDWETAKKYFSEGASVAVEPFDSNWEKGRVSDKPKLWRVGLLTAAYLYAFRTFGYRYIFQSCLDIVRDHIQQARTHQGLGLSLDFVPSRSINVAQYTEFYEHPEIGLFNPYRSDIPHHLRVYFLDYVIWLPIRYEFVFTSDTHSIDAEGLMVSAKEHVPHDGDPCIWESILGETDYVLDEDRVILRPPSITPNLRDTE